MLRQNEDSLVLHIGCGLDSRCMRVRSPYSEWLDCDLPDVIEVRKKYFPENSHYHMLALDASDPEQIIALPDSDFDTAIVVLEGLSMYLTIGQLRGFLQALEQKYRSLHILMDVYTGFGARVSKYKNPVNDVGVTRLYGIDDIGSVISGLRIRFVKEHSGLRIRFVKEHSFTSVSLIDELDPAEKVFFKLMFTGRLYGKIYRLFELEA